MEFELTSVGDALFVSRVLNATAMMSNSGVFQALAAIGFLIGLFAVAIKTIQSQKADFSAYAAGFVVYCVMFWPTADVIVVDASPSMGRPAIQNIRVDNVPVGVAGMGWFVSSVSSILREKMLTAFSVPGVTEGMATGDGATTRAIEALAAMRSMSDPQKNTLMTDATSEMTTLMMNLKSFIARCSELEVSAQTGRLSTLMNARNPMDPLSGLGSTEEWIGVDQWNYDAGSRRALPITKSCAQASEDLDTQLQSPATLELVKASLAPMLKLEGDDFDATWDVAERIIVGAASRGYAGDANLAGTAALSMQRYAVAHVVGGALQKTVASAQANNHTMALNIVLGDAMAQRNTQWVLEESLFLQMARPISAFFESMVYICAPFMAFALGLGSFGLSMALRYTQLTIWVMLWGPTMAAINLFQVTMAEAAFEATARGHGKSGDLGSIAGAVKITEDAESWIAIGSMLMASTPAITLMLLFGSAMTAVGLANRLQSADTINEKNASPDAVSTGAGVAVQPAFQGQFGNATGGARMAALPSISIGGDQSIQQSSSVRQAREAVAGFTSDESMALGNQLRMDRQAGTRGTEAGESRKSLDAHAALGRELGQEERWNQLSAAQKHMAVETALTSGAGAHVDGAMAAGGFAGMARGAAAKGGQQAAQQGAKGGSEAARGAEQVAGSTGIPLQTDYRSSDMSRAEVREAMELGRMMAARAKEDEGMKAALGRAAVSRLEDYQAQGGTRSDTADRRSQLIAQNQDVARAADTFDQADAYKANFGTQQNLSPGQYLGALGDLQKKGQLEGFKEQAAQLEGFGGAMQATMNALKGLHGDHMTGQQIEAAAFAMVLSGSSNFPGGKLGDADQAAGRMLLGEALTQGGLPSSADRAIGGQGDATRFDGVGDQAREGAQTVQRDTEAAISGAPAPKSREQVSGEIAALESRTSGAGQEGGAARAEASQLEEGNLLNNLKETPEAARLAGAHQAATEDVREAGQPMRDVRDAITEDHAFSGLSVPDSVGLLGLASRPSVGLMGDGDGEGNPSFEGRKQEYMEGVGGAAPMPENIATIMAFLDSTRTGSSGNGFGQYEDSNLKAPSIREDGAVNNEQLAQVQAAIESLSPAQETQLGETFEAFGYQGSLAQAGSPLGGALDSVGITLDNPLLNPSGDGDLGSVGTRNDAKGRQSEDPTSDWGDGS
jgi:hypothetical protein